MKQSRYAFKGIAVVSLVVLVIVVLQLFLTPNSTIGDIQSSNDTLTVEAKTVKGPGKPTIHLEMANDGTAVKIKVDKTARAEGYRVYMSRTKNGSRDKIKTAGVATAMKKAWTYTKKNLEPGTYYFCVRAYSYVNKVKVWGDFSAKAKITIDGDTEENGKNPERTLTFRNRELLEQHYVKHGKDMGFASAKDYEAAAAAVVVNAKALHKTEAEDGDDVYYVEETNEFVIVSTDGYIRTYFLPDGGINYFNRQ